MLQADTILGGRYKLLDTLGEGGMSTVYRASDMRLGRDVAIKVLHAQFANDEPFVQRFQQEAEFAASLGAHPNIVDIYDIGQDGPLRYIVMQLVEGRSLKELIVAQAPFSVSEAFGIGAQVASALDFAHSRGLIHRDVKPQNILVTPDGVAKVTDFGIARSGSASQLTRTGMVIGTVHYFAPEQAKGDPATPQADIYSLGIILYEMLTAHLPFDADNPIGVAMQHIHSEPPSLWDYNPSLPASAVSVVMRALEKDPERRYRDAGEFAAALSSQPGGDMGDTTMIAPLPKQPPPQTTGVHRSVEAAPVVTAPPRRTIVREPASRAAPMPARRSHTLWWSLGAILLALALAVGAFWFTSNVLGGGGKPTATPTNTPRPKPKKKPTSTPLVVVAPTATPFIPTVAPPTFTPLPKPTSKPKPKPTQAPTVTPQPTYAPPGSQPTPTASG